MSLMPENNQPTTTNEWFFDVTLTGGEPVDKVAEHVGHTVGRLSAAAVIIWFSGAELINQLRRYMNFRKGG